MGPSRVAALETALREFREAGTRIVLAEVPLSRLLTEALPADVYPRFYDYVEAAAEGAGAKLIRVRALDVTFVDGDFREQSHLNRHGAGKLTGALADRAIIPALRELRSGSR